MQKPLKTAGLFDKIIAQSEKALGHGVKDSYRTFINHRGEVISVPSKQAEIEYHVSVQHERNDW